MATETNFLIREKCPACNSNHSKIIFDVPFTDASIKKYLIDFYGKQGGIEYQYLENGSYILEECLSCGLVYQKEILNDFLMERLYETWINPKTVFDEEERTFELDYYARYTQEIATIVGYLQSVPTQLRFLDFGMGWGKWLKLVSGFGIQAYGMELSQSRIDYAKGFGIKILLWEELSQSQFDLVNTEQVFEHIPKPLDTLLELKKALKPGGIIKISVPNGRGLSTRLKNLDWKAEKKSKYSFNPVSPLEHINCFNNKSIVRMAQEAGLVQVRIPLHAQYALVGGNTSIKELLKNIVKPFYRNYFGGTYLFFKVK